LRAEARDAGDGKPSAAVVAALVENHRRFLAFLERVDLGGVRPLDFAVEIGITPNHAMVRLHRARRTLRDQLPASCRTWADHGCRDCSCARRPAPQA